MVCSSGHFGDENAISLKNVNLIFCSPSMVTDNQDSCSTLVVVYSKSGPSFIGYC